MMQHSEITWTKPSPNSIILNVDASFHSGICTARLMVRDHLGIPSYSAIYFDTKSCPLNAELWAIQKAFQLIDKFHIQNVTIETDCFNAVALLKGTTCVPPWQNYIEVHACRRIMSLHPLISLKFTRRQANQVAHQLAQWGFRFRTPVEGLFDQSLFDADLADLIRFESTL